MTHSKTVNILLVDAIAAIQRLGSPYNNSVGSMTTLDVLCAVVTITNATYYDYYKLATFRPASQCSRVSSSEFQQANEKAANLRRKYIIIHMRILA